MKPLVELTCAAASWQLDHGNDFVLEVPTSVQAAHYADLDELTNHSVVECCLGHSCQFGLTNNSGGLVRRSTWWVSSGPELDASLNLQCAADHCCSADHFAHYANWSAPTASAVLLGFTQTLERKEPGRLLGLCRSLDHRVRAAGVFATDQSAWLLDYLRDAEITQSLMRDLRSLETALNSTFLQNFMRRFQSLYYPVSDDFTLTLDILRMQNLSALYDFLVVVSWRVQQ